MVAVREERHKRGDEIVELNAQSDDVCENETVSQWAEARILAALNELLQVVIGIKLRRPHRVEIKCTWRPSR